MYLECQETIKNLKCHCRLLKPLMTRSRDCLLQHEGNILWLQKPMHCVIFDLTRHHMVLSFLFQELYMVYLKLSQHWKPLMTRQSCLFLRLAQNSTIDFNFNSWFPCWTTHPLLSPAVYSNSHFYSVCDSHLHWSESQSNLGAASHNGVWQVRMPELFLSSYNSEAT